MTVPYLREASPADLPGLVDLENTVFPGDRISRRDWRHLLTSPSALVTVSADAEGLTGCSVLLTNRRSAVARLYSLAVALRARHQGIARALLQEAIAGSAGIGAHLLRLETRSDNIAAQRLFARCGFQPFKRVPHYYEDGTEAIRFQRLIDADCLRAVTNHSSH
ncbi:GNAT family N-acetyltransferase [Labrys neptuniae]